MAMQGDGMFQGFIAFNPETVYNWTTQSREMMPITPEWFGGNSQGNYVPLKPNMLAAVKAALEASANYHVAAKAATETTRWWILTLTLNPNELMQAWTSGILHWDSKMSGIEWWASLQPTEIGLIEWDDTELMPIGLGSWTFMTCERKFRRPKGQGVCGGCRAGAVPVWKATSRYDHINYCALCWNDFVTGQQWENEQKDDAMEG